MKKLVFVFLFSPLLLLAQWQNSLSFPNKLYFIDYLNPKEKSFALDSAKIGSTTLQYRSFSTKGQMIDVSHTQSLNDYFQFNFDLRKFAQEGVFTREALKLYDLSSNLSFHNKKSTYNVDALLSYSKIRMDEDGGIIDYSIENYDDPLLYQSNLLSAENYSKNRFHSISQNFDFAPNWSIFNKFSILRSHRIYNDNDLTVAFYQDNFLDSVYTNDSLSLYSITNTLGIKYSNFSLAHILHRRHNFIHSIDSTDNDNGLAFVYSTSNNDLVAEIAYFESSHYKFKASKKIAGNRVTQLLSVSAQRFRTPVFYNTFYSNHYIFDNDFNQEKSQMIDYKISSDKFTFHTSISNYQDHIFLDENAYYSQHTSSITHLDNFLSFDWKVLNLHATNSLQYQWSNNPEILRYPDINTTFSIWLKGEFFNDLLDVKLGGAVNYFSPYYAKLYNPALASFQLQNEKEIGGLPFISSFINFHVHSMNIDIQFLNLNELISNSPHYFMPNYPSQPSAIKFSLIWELDNT